MKCARREVLLGKPRGLHLWIGELRVVLSPRMEKLTSHCVLVVDKSGSMRTGDVVVDGSDVPLSRNNALFDNLLEVLIPDQEANGGDGGGDVYSLILFNDVPQVVFKHACIEEAKEKLVESKNIKCRDGGKYIPALDALEEVLNDALSMSAGCTTILFLSDGTPSDVTPKGKGTVEEKVADLVRSRLDKAVGPCIVSARANKSVLHFHAIGFGPETEFLCLSKMAKAISLQGGERNRSVTGQFHTSALAKTDLTQSMTKFSSSIVESRLFSQTIGANRRVRDVRMLKNHAFDEANFVEHDVQVYSVDDKQVPDPNNPSALKATNQVYKVMIADTAFGRGGERNAFYFKFLQGTMANMRCVAKEDKHLPDAESGEDGERQFHLAKIVAQKKGSVLAAEFSKEIKSLGFSETSYSVSFPVCHMCKTKDNRLYHVEQYFPGTFTKWNSNNGYVKSKPKSSTFLKPTKLVTLAEGDESDEEELLKDLAASAEDYAFDDFDVPQAFSHWSAEKSEAHVGVSFVLCDLQGFLDVTDIKLRKFTFIDPVIHSQVANTYAKTDHGLKGRDNFFRSHRCNGLCRLLKLTEVKVAPTADAAAAGDTEQTTQPWTTSVNTAPDTNEKNMSVPSVPTSLIPINKTKHLADRQKQREIPTKLLQRAKKHGVATPARDGLVKHVFDGIAYIENPNDNVGVTGYAVGVPDDFTEVQSKKSKSKRK